MVLLLQWGRGGGGGGRGKMINVQTLVSLETNRRGKHCACVRVEGGGEEEEGWVEVEEGGGEEG